MNKDFTPKMIKKQQDLHFISSAFLQYQEGCIYPLMQDFNSTVRSQPILNQFQLSNPSNKHMLNAQLKLLGLVSSLYASPQSMLTALPRTRRGSQQSLTPSVHKLFCCFSLSLPEPPQCSVLHQPSYTCMNFIDVLKIMFT